MDEKSGGLRRESRRGKIGERVGWAAGRLLAAWPEEAVLFLCALILCAGIGRKEGFHMDELLSFELSNAEFNPWIVPNQPQGRLAKFVQNEIDGENLWETLGNIWDVALDVLKNRGGSRLLTYRADVYQEPVWIDRETFRDYITVGTGDAFHYLSVYFNVKDDNHPPLHFMLLHTMSSLFRGSAEPFVGCVINLGATLGTLCLLMAAGRRLGRLCFPKGNMSAEQTGRILGLMAALLYGLSAGAMAATLLIRMYALLAFFCLAAFYIHLKKWTEGSFFTGNRLLILVTVLGFLTQYFFLFYCLPLAAVTAAGLFLRGRRRELLVYLRSMVSAALIGVAVFPFAVSDVFSSGRGVEALENLSQGFAGYGVRLAAFWEILSQRVLGASGPALALILLGGVLGVWAQGRVRRGRAIDFSPWQGRFEILGMLLLPAAAYFLLAARMSPYLVDRYLMPLFPLAALCLALLAVGFVYLGRYKKGGYLFVCGAAALWPLLGLLGYGGDYLYLGYEDQRKLAEEYAALPCVCVYQGVGYYENLPEFTEYERTLLLKPEELAERRDRAGIREAGETVFLFKPGVDVEETMEVLRREYGLTLEEWLLEEGVHGDRIGLFTAG